MLGARLLLRGGANIDQGTLRWLHVSDGVVLRPGTTPLSLARERSAAGEAPEGSACDLVLQVSEPWSPETHPLRSASARARAVDLVRVGHLLSTSAGASLTPAIRTWLRSGAGRAFWLRIMSYVDMSAP